MHLFYAEPGDILESSLIVRGQEAEHIIKVLRHSVGDEIFVTDGIGKRYRCEISHFQKKSVFLDILQVEEKTVDRPSVTLCMGIIKKRDRLEFAIEKAVELGVSKIVLFTGDHSQKEKVRDDRLKATAIAAMKQSLRYFLPKIYIEDSLEKVISKHGNEQTIVVADETAVDHKINIQSKPEQNYLLVTGPEGGFSTSEREYLSGISPKYYSLGKYRLRTETAAMIMVDRFANLKKQ